MMFPQFTATASSLTKVSALVTGVGTDAGIYDDPQDADIPTLLDSRYDADKAQGLKRLIALMAQGRDVSSFFPQVVKGVASQSLEVKKLVYIYLVHYADKRPDEALLSINSFQRDLSDINPMVRAWALRAMSGIKVRAVIPLVVMAANKCARDPSSYVRRCAANAISKIYSVDDDQHFDALLELVSILLNDNSAGVVGAAAAAFIAVCPERYSLLKSSFRKLCGLLSDVDEWGQVALMDILMRYTVAKHGFPKNSVTSLSDRETKLELSLAKDVGDFYKIDSSDSSSVDLWELKLLLSCTLPLLWSHNSAVVLQAAGIQWFLAPIEEVSKIVKPLLFLLRSSYDAQHVVLANILSFSRSMPSLFEPYYEDFFIRSSDSQAVQALKLDILTNIVTDSSINAILQELEAYMRNPNSQFAADAVNAIGRCAVRLSSSAPVCTKGLLILATSNYRSLKEEESQFTQGDAQRVAKETTKHSQSQYNSSRGGVVIQAVLALRAIVQKHPTEQEQVLLHLLHNLKRIEEPVARAVVIWMVGEHGFTGTTISRTIPLVLRYLAKIFPHEADGTKLQTLNCFSKVILSSQVKWDSSLLKTVLLALQYVLNLGSCDLSYDIRDRTRMLRILLGGHLWLTFKQRAHEAAADLQVSELINRLLVDYAEQQRGLASDFSKLPDHHSEILSRIAKSLFLCPKVVPVIPSLSSVNSSFLPGSISHIVQHMAPGYRPLPRGKSLESSAQSSPRKRELENRSETQLNYESAYSDSDSGSAVSGNSISSNEENGDDNYSTGSRSNSSNDNRNSKNRLSSNVAETSNRFNLISLSDTETAKNDPAGEGERANVFNDGIQDMMPSVDLESWLGPQISEGPLTAPAGYVPVTFKISHCEPKKVLTLDFTNGDGLEVQYGFTRNSSIYSPNMVCLRLFFHNRSSEPLTGISIKDGNSQTASDWSESSAGFESGTAMVIPPQVISVLEPGEKTECNLHIDFRHNLKSIKLSVHCNAKRFPIKILPEPGALLRPYAMSLDAFLVADSRISGMHRSSRRILVRGLQLETNPEKKAVHISEYVSSKLLTAANVSLVGALSRDQAVGNAKPIGTEYPEDLLLHFSGETLTGSLLCLISVSLGLADTGSVLKVSCEDTLFGLAMLNQLDKALTAVES